MAIFHYVCCHAFALYAHIMESYVYIRLYK